MNMKKIRYHAGILLCLTLFGGSAIAQQTTEAAANLEKIFVDACRERMIGNYDKAVPLLQDLLRKDNSNHAAMYELARVYDARKEYEPALKQMSAAVSLDPSNIWYQKFLADLHQKTGNFLAAASIYESLVRQSPNQPEYYFKWAFFLVKSEQVEQAIKVYDELEKRTGVNEEAVRHKHTLYIGMGNPRKAAEELQRLINAFPRRLEYRHLLAGFYEQIGEKSQAKEVYKQILSIAPSDSKAQLALAGQGGSGNDEISWLSSLKPVFENPAAPIDPKMGKIIPLIQKVANSGDTTLANATLELTAILERVHPGQAKPLAASGDLYYYSGRKKEAESAYRRALDNDKAVFAVWEQLMSIQLESGHFSELAKTAEDALDYFPNRAINYYFIGIAALEQGNTEDAESALDQARLMVGNDSRLMSLLSALQGGIAHVRKSFAESDAAFAEALAKDPQSAFVLSAYSYCLMRRNERLDQAGAMAVQANQLLPGAVRTLHTLGWRSLRQKEWTAALRFLSEAAALNEGRDALLLEHYGDALFHTGDAESAFIQWEKSRARGNRSPALERKIAERRYIE
jgi:tetratricopeptide (TPR) repeat protein